MYVSRETLCRAICRLDHESHDFISLGEFNFVHGPKLQLLLYPRGSEDSCILKAMVTISGPPCNWPHSDPTIKMVLSATVLGNSTQPQQTLGESNCTTTLHQACYHIPQTIILPHLVSHRTITHEITDSSLLFIVNANLSPDRSSHSQDDFIIIDTVSRT